MKEYLRAARFEIVDVVERAPYTLDVEYPSQRMYMFARRGTSKT